MKQPAPTVGAPNRNYWFAMYRPVTKEELGLRPLGGNPLSDWLLFGYLSYMWRGRSARPISLFGWLAAAALVAGLGVAVAMVVVFATADNIPLYMAIVFGWTALVVIGYTAIFRKTCDPERSVESYDAERLAAERQDPNKPWLRWEGTPPSVANFRAQSLTKGARQGDEP